MISHEACTSGTFRVLTVASLQRLKMEALIPAPADCEMRSVIKILNEKSMAPIEIHRQLCQQSFPADFPFLVQNCHGAPVVQKIVRQVGAKSTDTWTQSKATALTIVVQLFLRLKRFLSGQRQRFQSSKYYNL